MSIDVGGCLNVAVTEPFLHIFDTKSFAQQNTCAAVALQYNYDKLENSLLSKPKKFSMTALSRQLPLRLILCRIKEPPAFTA